MQPQGILKETQASKLGYAPASPSSSTIISSSFSTLYFYHFMCYVLCLEHLALYLEHLQPFGPQRRFAALFLAPLGGARRGDKAWRAGYPAAAPRCPPSSTKIRP